MNLEKKIFWALLIITCIIPAKSIVSAEEVTQSPQMILQKLIASENKIKDIQANFSAIIVEKNNFPNYNFNWGYAGGKEFMRGRENYTKTEDVDDNKIDHSTRIEMSFNGEKMFTLRKDIKASQAGLPSHGFIGHLDSSAFKAYLTPAVLLGFNLHEMGRLSLAEAIRQADSYSIEEQIETIDGHSCYVINVIGVECDPEVENLCWDAKVWLDYQRDFRPLRIEKYQSIPGKNRWKALSKRIYQIKLRNFSGVWFPIEGVRTHFSVKFKPPKDFTREDAKGLSLKNFRERVAQIELENLQLTRKMSVEPNNVRINKGIPAEEFEVKFPFGCRVFDEFIQAGYTVGAKDEITTPRLNDTNINHKKTANTNYKRNKKLPQQSIDAKAGKSKRINDKNKLGNIDKRTNGTQSILILLYLSIGAALVLLLLLVRRFLKIRKKQL